MTHDWLIGSLTVIIFFPPWHFSVTSSAITKSVWHSKVADYFLGKCRNRDFILALDYLNRLMTALITCTQDF